MNPEDVAATCDACGDAGDGARVAVERVGLIEDVADDGLSRDGEQDGAGETMQAVGVAEDGEVVVTLFGEVDAGVEDEMLGAQTGAESEGDF